MCAAPDGLAALQARLANEARQTRLAASLREPLAEMGSPLSYVRARGCLAAAAELARASASEADAAALRALLNGKLPVDLLSLVLGGALGGPAAEAEADPLARWRAPAAAEARAACLLLRGACLLDARTRDAAGALGGLEALLARAAAAAGADRAAALDAAAAMLAGSEANQAAFTALRGAAAVAALAAPGGAGEPPERCPAALAFLHTLLARGGLGREAARAAEAVLGPALVARVHEGAVHAQDGVANASA